MSRVREASGLTLAIAGLVLLGIGVAGYLTYVHYAAIDPVCAGGSGGCHRVQASDYAELVGLPVAVIGLAGYLGLAVTLLIPGEAGRASGMALALIGAGFSLYLTYLELFVIDAICQWCVASAVIMIALAGLTTARMLRGPDPVPERDPAAA
jgi:uncharacterized membrane protein